MRNRFHAQQGDGCQRRGDGSNVRLQSERCVLYMIVFCKPWWSCRDVMLLGLKQGRAGQGRAGQGRTGQARAEHTGPCTHQTQTLSDITQ